MTMMMMFYVMMMVEMMLMYDDDYDDLIGIVSLFLSDFITFADISK